MYYVCCRQHTEYKQNTLIIQLLLSILLLPKATLLRGKCFSQALSENVLVELDDEDGIGDDL